MRLVLSILGVDIFWHAGDIPVMIIFNRPTSLPPGLHEANGVGISTA
ncbi:MAG TPA: hypothetical protein VK789_02495 [Bryobacteraceae bacterium]|jgi:hypothetical protein|nr:hypothetical protein [Bryobacteraceae bacterium]